jgi:hypothetical protein
MSEQELKELESKLWAAADKMRGAVAVSEALLYFTYFCKKEWGPDFYKHANDVVETTYDGTQRTILKEIQQYWQQIIYTINQPAAARGFQSAFVNFSYFDKPFFEGMFGDFYFPDGTKPDWESLKWIQMEFMKWFNEERLRTILTFPVETVTLLYKDGKFLDEEMYNFVCEEYARGHSFFTYISDSVDSLSSCCFKGDEKITFYDKNGFEFNTSLEYFVNTIDYTTNKLGGKVPGDYYIDSYTLDGKVERVKITGILKKEYTGSLFTFMRSDGNHITVTADHEVMVMDESDNVFSLRASDVFTHYESYRLINKNMFPVKIQHTLITNANKDDVYDIELEKNHYFAANDIISHNCRLKNKIQTKEFNFTNGNVGIN